MAVGHKVTTEIKNLTPQCKIVIYNWDERDPGKDSSEDALSKSSRLDVSSQLLSFSYSKNMNGPSGAFTFTLSNSPGNGSQDWKDLIARGSWCLIYLTQDGDLTLNPDVGPPLKEVKPEKEAAKIRCVGFIDRVSVRSELSEKGAFDIVYEISGRDFGVVYEDSISWNNIFAFDKILLDSVRGSKLDVLGAVTIDKALGVMHDLLLYPANLPNTDRNSRNSLLSIGLQWLMPYELVSDLGMEVTSETYWGALPETTDFGTTEATLAISSPTDYLFGGVWQNLKRMSVPELHELFTETSDEGKPRLVFRPIPFGIDNSNYPTQSQHAVLYKDLEPVVNIPAVSVYGFDVGEDNHSRYNSFLVTLSTSLINMSDNVSNLKGSGFPNHQFGSIRRYGFRPMHIVAHSLVRGKSKLDGVSDAVLHREFNHVLQDYWENAIYAESGTARIVGTNEVKIGKAMTFGVGTPYVSDKRYYIEGYTDTFIVEENGARTWDATLFLTRGFEEDDLIANDVSHFSRRKEGFARSGEYTPSGDL